MQAAKLELEREREREERGGVTLGEKGDKREETVDTEKEEEPETKIEEERRERK